MHTMVGKINFEAKHIEENIKAFLDAIEDAKPA
jgi:ribosomal protein L1